MRPLLEIIASSPQDCIVAQTHGANRIELVSAIELGGLTPSIGLTTWALAATQIPVMAMVRPRSGGFNYTDDEFAAMMEDVAAFKRAGIHGIVVGILQDDRTLDKDRMVAVAQLAARMELVCHRAFDATLDPAAALETLIQLRFTRVLTSGQKPSCLEGAPLIKSLRAQAKGRIQILPGAGLKSDNIRAFIEETGVDQIHMTAYEEIPDHSMNEVPLQFNSRTAAESCYRRVTPGQMKMIEAALEHGRSPKNSRNRLPD